MTVLLEENFWDKSPRLMCEEFFKIYARYMRLFDRFKFFIEPGVNSKRGYGLYVDYPGFGEHFISIHTEWNTPETVKVYKQIIRDIRKEEKYNIEIPSYVQFFDGSRRYLNNRERREIREALEYLDSGL